MPRRRSLEKAVSSSPLFLLSPEIRTMIYSLLLTTSEQIAFGEHPRRHLSYLRRIRSKHLKPDLHPKILRTCRLIHQEACPLLYRGNSFYFREPETSDTFRWVTSSKHAAWVEEISTTMNTVFWSDVRLGPVLRDRESWLEWVANLSVYWNFPRWIEHFGKGRFNLTDNYSHLKRLTISMGDGILMASTKNLCVVCELIGQSIRLESVHIIGLNDETMIEAFKPMVEKPRTSPQDRRSVQVDITELRTRVGWKNVTLWWGLENGTSPRHAIRPEEDLGRRRSLFRMGDGPNYSYGFGESVILNRTL